MATVSGPLSVVTGDPAAVTSVTVHARSVRPEGDGVVTTLPAPVPIGAGATISFPCVEGEAVLVLKVADAPALYVPLIVDGSESMTLAAAVRAARLADGRTADELGDLVRRVLDGADRAEAAADRVDSGALTVSEAVPVVVDARDEAVSAAGTATGAASTAASARDAAVLARNEAEGFKAQAATSAQAAGDDAASAQLAESGAGTARDQAQSLVSAANSALDQALAVIADAESLQDVVAALENVDNRISAAIADLVGAAPEHLDTLGELAAAVEGMDPALRDLIAERLALADVAVDVIASKVVRRTSSGDVLVPSSPSGASSAVARDWVQAQLTAGLSGKANATHSHTMEDVAGLGDVLDAMVYWDEASIFPFEYTIAFREIGGALRVGTPTASDHAATKSYVDGRKAFFSGDGPPPSSIPGAVVGDYYLNETDMSLHKIEGV